MARVTIEDCLKKIDNHFDVVLIAAKRAKQLLDSGNAMAKVDPGDDLATVIALREIEAGEIGRELLEVGDTLHEDFEASFSQIAEEERPPKLPVFQDEDDKEPLLDGIPASDIPSRELVSLRRQMEEEEGYGSGDSDPFKDIRPTKP